MLEAIADVRSGEELTYCYLRSFAEGARETLVPWGFECDCGRCSGAPATTAATTLTTSASTTFTSTTTTSSSFTYY